MVAPPWAVWECAAVLPKDIVQALCLTNSKGILVRSHQWSTKGLVKEEGEEGAMDQQVGRMVIAARGGGTAGACLSWAVAPPLVVFVTLFVRVETNPSTASAGLQVLLVADAGLEGGGRCSGWEEGGVKSVKSKSSLHGKFRLTTGLSDISGQY